MADQDDKLREHAERFAEWRRQSMNGGFQAFGVDLADIMYKLTAEEWRAFSWFLLRANHETGQCFYSLERIAREWGVTKRAVMRRIQALVDRGLIERVQRLNASSYTLITPWAFKEEARASDGGDEAAASDDDFDMLEYL